jgi:hypothetical protein
VRVKAIHEMSDEWVRCDCVSCDEYMLLFPAYMYTCTRLVFFV